MLHPQETLYDSLKCTWNSWSWWYSFTVSLHESITVCFTCIHHDFVVAHLCNDLQSKYRLDIEWRIFFREWVENSCLTHEDEYEDVYENIPAFLSGIHGLSCYRFVSVQLKVNRVIYDSKQKYWLESQSCPPDLNRSVFILKLFFDSRLCKWEILSQSLMTFMRERVYL